jgi:bifunctional non-homologous end joining protein LigD
VSPHGAPPEHVAPMLATLGRLPADQERHTYEFKWDGIRAVVHWDGSSLRLETRNLRDVTVAYPELQALGPLLGARPVVLDGEVVALDATGVPSFQRLQERMHVGDARTAARRAERVPARLFLFDLLHLGDRSTLDLPWTERRALLESLALAGPSWATPPSFPGEGDATFAAARDRGLEGVVAKRLDGRYVPGARSRDWVKVKFVLRDEFVVGGWLPGEGGRRGRIGALLLGLPAGGGKLTYTGGVGTGFTDADLRRLGAELDPDVRPESPFTTRLPRRDAVFVEPRLVVDVEYRQRTDAGILRQPSYKGIRPDLLPADLPVQPGPGRP